MTTVQAILIFILIVTAAVLIAVIGILCNLRKAAKLFRDTPEDPDPPQNAPPEE